LFPDGLTAVTSAVQSLEKLGYLKRTQLFGEHGKFVDVRWDIDPEPADSPCTENPYTDDAYTENPPQYNIITSNTNKSLSKKESAPQPEKMRSSYNEIIAEYTDDSELRIALGNYIAMRKLKRLPITNAGLLLLLKELDAFASDVPGKIGIVNDAIMKSSSKFYSVKKEAPADRPQGSFDTKETFTDALKKSYGDDYDKIFGVGGDSK
jgi:hypothetical protein